MNAYRSRMGRAALEDGPEDNERCEDCNGSGIQRDDFGGEWTCTTCLEDDDQ